MATQTDETGVIADFLVSTELRRELQAFLLEQRARGNSPNTLDFYQKEITYLIEYAHARGLDGPRDITPRLLRTFFAYLQDRGRNAGGIHSMYRALRSFFNWLAQETGLPSPVAGVRVKAPSQDPKPGIPMADVLKMAAVCGTGFFGYRDRALILALVDTGLRRNELLGLDVGDWDPGTGALQVRVAKGGRPRQGYTGVRTTKTILKYLRLRGPLTNDSPLWVNRYGTRLKPKGLEAVVYRRADQAGIPRPGVHDFRRTFALESLRNGMDVYSLMRLMGHTSPQVLMRYLALANEDLKTAHDHASPVDRAKK